MVLFAFSRLSADQRKLEDLRLLKEHISKNSSANSKESFASKVMIARIDEELRRSRRSISLRKKNIQKPTPSSTTRALRVLLIDAPMTALFSLLMISILIQKYYAHYISPTIDAANWADNDAIRLDDEFTYYSRECDVSDVTTDSIKTVVVDENKHTAADIVEHLMEHGISVIPSLVDEQNSHALREYIMKRNTELTSDETIPLDGPVGRWSFGIHANEDPSVAATLEQLSSNPLLISSLTNILGRNPAVAEITAITVAPGADSQGWHSDVKQLGNSLKYAQTFTHSYSLFLPLQNVTAAMGATELCPGTHYCATADLEQTCIDAGFQAAGPGEEDVWKVGDGLVMNQKMWHRGAAYTARTGPHRVVFIVTFISRPDPGVDHRQLSHGTYFHIHPRMYGHTLKDLQNARVYMTEPFATLRSLGIWKPPDSDWGWDWATSSAVRIANEENGYSVGELFEFVESHSLASMIPSWLQGSVDENGGWQLYFKETTDNFVLLFKVLYFVALTAIFTATLLVDSLQKFKHRYTVSFLKRLLLFNGVILLISHMFATKAKNTQYAKSVDNKTIFARPFVPMPQGRGAAAVIKDVDSTMMDMDLTKPSRPSTIPEKYDVLFGNRHDSRHIGFYVNYLNYHPGNKRWSVLLGTYSPLYKSYSGLPQVFRAHIESTVEKYSASEGRMLTQNYYGEWMVMNNDDRRNQIRKSLFIGINGIYSSLDQELSILLAEARHGILLRGSNAMQKQTLKQLSEWKEMVAPRSKPVAFQSLKEKKIQLRSSLFQIKSKHFIEKPKPTRREVTLDRNVIDINIGDAILVNYRGTGYWILATLIYKEFTNYGIAEFDHIRERAYISLRRVKPFRGIQEGDEIAVFNKNCERCPITFENASVLKAHQDITCDVLYENGDIEERVPKDELAFRSLE